MSAAILSPKEFSPVDLDNYLAKGWRPYGQQIYTADYIQLQLGQVYSVLPTRLDLAKHKWRKGQRKLLNKRKKEFQYTIGPAVLTEEKIRINDKYRNLFPTKAVEDLNIHLKHEGGRIFNTQEVCIYHDGKLVSFSFFDLGEQCIYSKVGIYDPAYQYYSLGIFSMYLEVEWCVNHDLTYYYPGYISPETPLFDYKKKVGELDFWSMQGKGWLPLASFEMEEHSPFKKVELKTKAILNALEKAGVKGKIYDYCFFEMPLMYPSPKPYLDSPKLIVLHYPDEKNCWIVRYKIEYDTFECWQTNCEYKVSFLEPANRKWPIFQFVLQLKQPFIQTDEMETFVKGVKKLIGDKQQLLFPLKRN